MMKNKVFAFKSKDLTNAKVCAMIYTNKEATQNESKPDSQKPRRVSE